MKVLPGLINKRSVRVVALMVMLAAAFIAGVISKDITVSKVWAQGDTTKSGTLIIYSTDYDGIIDGKPARVWVDRPYHIPATFTSCEASGNGFVCLKVDCLCCP